MYLFCHSFIFFWLKILAKALEKKRYSEWAVGSRVGKSGGASYKRWSNSWHLQEGHGTLEEVDSHGGRNGLRGSKVTPRRPLNQMKQTVCYNRVLQSFQSPASEHMLLHFPALPCPSSAAPRDPGMWQPLRFPLLAPL